MFNNRKSKANVRDQRQNPRKPQGLSSKERGNRAPHGMVLYRKLPDQTRIMRCLRDTGNVVLNGSSLLAILNFTSRNAYSNTNFSNIAQEFQAYRVRAMRYKQFPVYNIAAAHVGTNDYPLGVFISGLWWDLAAAAASNILQTDNMKSFGTNEKFSTETNFIGFPDAQLWTETTQQIPNTQMYGISLALSPNVTYLEPSQNLASYIVEYDVEFQGMQ